MENTKMIFRKTSNYNADIVVNVEGIEKAIATCYATFTTGESVSKTMILNDEELYTQNAEEVNAKIAIFNQEVDKLAQFHNVPIV